MIESVYILCALTSVLCAFLLLRSFLRTRVRLLLWSAICFAGLALNNILLCVDVLAMPTVDLGLLRAGSALCGMLALVIGLIWESS